MGNDLKHNRIYSTLNIIAAEKEMVAGAKRLRAQSGFVISEESLELALRQKEYPLSDEQREAVLGVCQGNRFAVLQGSAGAGKSASMDCVRAAYEHEGHTVIGAAIAKMAAENLSQEANIETFTVAKLLSDIDRGLNPLRKGSVLLVDEAGQLGSRQLLSLISAVESADGKLVLVGEDRQLDSIEHGGSLRYLSAPHVLGTTRIQTIRRQRCDWAKKAVADFRDGNALSALQLHKQRGLLHFGENAEGTKKFLVEEWDDFRKKNPEKKSLIVAQRWTDVAMLNTKVRALLQQDGVLGKDEITVECCVSERHISCQMAVGERVRFTKNDYQYGLVNGDLGTLTALERSTGGDTRFEIQTDKGRKVTFKGSDYSDEKGHVYLNQAYAVTVYSSQGLTVDGATFVYYTSGMDRANTYVACSRHRDDCHIYVNTKEIGGLENGPTPFHDDDQKIRTLAGLMSKDGYKKLAIEYLEAANLEPERKNPTLQPEIFENRPAFEI